MVTMKETSKRLLEELILGERSWDANEVLQAMAEDQEFASSVGATRQTLAALEANAGRIDDVPHGSIHVTDEDRAATRAALRPQSKSPILRHGMWLLPSAAAAILLFSYMQDNSTPGLETPNATLGGSESHTPLAQQRTGFRTFNLGKTLAEGSIARIECFATDLEEQFLFTTGQIKLVNFQLKPDQLAALQDLDRVWIVIEWVQAAGHSRTSPGQWWDR